MELVWQDPPERTRSSKWRDIAEQLAAKPGQWAQLNEYEGENAKRNAYSLAGRIRKLFGDEFEVTSRIIPNTDKAGVWGRKKELTDDQLLDALADSKQSDNDLMGDAS